MLLLLQTSTLAFAVFTGISGMLAGSFGSDIPRLRIRLHQNYRHD